MTRLLIPVAALPLVDAQAKARTKAAKYPIGQVIAESCDNRGGRIDPCAVIERDLAGDGRDDLIVTHEN